MSSKFVLLYRLHIENYCEYTNNFFFQFSVIKVKKNLKLKCQTIGDKVKIL